MLRLQVWIGLLWKEPQSRCLVTLLWECGLPRNIRHCHTTESIPTSIKLNFFYLNEYTVCKGRAWKLVSWRIDLRISFWQHIWKCHLRCVTALQRSIIWGVRRTGKQLSLCCPFVCHVAHSCGHVWCTVVTVQGEGFLSSCQHWCLLSVLSVATTIERFRNPFFGRFSWVLSYIAS